MANLAYQVTGFAYQGIGQFAYQGSIDAVTTATPGRTLRPGRTFIPGQITGETNDEKLARRIREGTIVPEVVQSVTLPVVPTAEFYFKESAKLTASIEKFRAESAAIRKQIAVIEQQQLIETLRAAERKRLERRLTIAMQELQMAQLQEAIILEQIEVIDVAYLALVTLNVVLQ